MLLQFLYALYGFTASKFGGTASHLPELTPQLWQPLIGHKFISSKYIKFDMKTHSIISASLALPFIWQLFVIFNLPRHNQVGCQCRYTCKLDAIFVSCVCSSLLFAFHSPSVVQCLCWHQRRTNYVLLICNTGGRSAGKSIGNYICERTVEIKRSDEVVHCQRASATS